MAAFLQQCIPGWHGACPGVRDQLDAPGRRGFIHWPDSGGAPGLKLYLEAGRPRRRRRLHRHRQTRSNTKEKVGYPAQKPAALVELLIAAASNPGDAVLDPSAACATAGKQGRRWAGAGISPTAGTLIRKRLERELGWPAVCQRIGRTCRPALISRSCLTAAHTSTPSTANRKDAATAAASSSPSAAAPSTASSPSRKAASRTSRT